MNSWKSVYLLVIDGLDEWNDGGYERLQLKYKNSGRKGKLTDEQFNELDEWMSHKSLFKYKKSPCFH
jgi:transposase